MEHRSINKNKQEMGCTADIERSEILIKGPVQSNSFTPATEEIKAEFPLINVFKVEQNDDDSEVQEPGGQSKNEYNYNCNKNLNEDHFDGEVQSEIIQRREIFPEANENYSNILKLPQFLCCLIEHDYCPLRKTGSASPKDRNETNESTCSSPRNAGTFEFENKFEFVNRTEQQTIDGIDSVTKHVDSNSDLSNSSSIKARLRKRPVNKNSKDISTCASVVTDTYRKRKSTRKLSPKIRIKRPSLNGSRSYVDLIQEARPSLTQSILSLNTESNVVSRILENRDLDSNKADGEKPVISLDDIAKEISEMEKIIQSKCEILNDDVEKSTDNADAKGSETLPSKLRKLSSKEDLSEPQKEGERVLSVPKMAPEDKNWNLEYTEDDVKNLGLDDLLLRASELNAENFTKALGQNSSRNGNKGDSSEIVLTFPGPRRESGDPLECDNSKGGNVKKTKLEFFKKCVKDDNAIMACKFVKALDEELVKKVPEVPKRSGIKVKTVQNINEEFNDSLGAKLKNLERRDMASESSTSLFTISDDLPKNNQTKEVFVSDAREQLSETQPTLLGCRKMNKSQDQNKGAEEIAEDTRPFVMTIIQNKDNSAKDHMPSALSAKGFVKSKAVCSESGNFLPTIEDQRSDVTNNKKTEGVDSNSGENVTLVVAEPRTFEVVNVDNYSLDGGVKKNFGINSHYVVNYGSITKKDGDGKIVVHATLDSGSVACRKKNFPILLNSKKKYLRMPSSNQVLVTAVEDPNKRIKCGPRPSNRVIKYSSEGTVQSEKTSEEEPSFTVTSIEQNITAKDSGTGGGRFVKLMPNNSKNVSAMGNCPRPEDQSNSDIENDHVSQPKEQMMTLTAFSNILKDILPDKWILSLDKKFGLQIIKTHLDELLNPSIMISVVVGRTGKVTVNVRGRQLEKSHDLFANLCDVGNSSEKISINYILAIINKLRFFNVCFGCDDLSLKKYWCEDGFIEYYTEFQQTYRSHICESLVRLGKKRCYPCYRMHESLKKRKRREQLLKKSDPDSTGKTAESGGSGNDAIANIHQAKGVKRNLEEFLEESFINMKQKIADEIERTKEDEENEKVPKTQDEVLSFMGLTRKDSLDVNLRKSKRKKKGFRKCESVIANNVNKEELYFLEKYWPDINVLFSTSLLFGAYSRSSTGRLREKCKMFHKLLSTWRGIIRDNPDWVGGHINLAENLVDDDDTLNSDLVKKKFDKMDVPALRAYIINCVKEVNKIKSRLRTKNHYFKVLYNTFVKPRMKKVRQTSEPADSSGGKPELGAARDSSKEEIAPEKAEDSKLSASTELESSDENSQHSSGAVPCISDGD